MDVDTRASHLPVFYTIIVSGVEFKLTQSQIEFNSPNYFTAAFLQHDFVEAQSKILVLDKDPLLFRYIVLYLSGYEVLPLQLAAIPITMSIETATRNLAIDAEYFGLDLTENIQDYSLSLLPPVPSKPDYINELGYTRIVELDDIISKKVVIIKQLNPEGRQVHQIEGTPFSRSPPLIRIRNCTLNMTSMSSTRRHNGEYGTVQILSSETSFNFKYAPVSNSIVVTNKSSRNSSSLFNVTTDCMLLPEDPQVPIIIDEEVGTLADLYVRLFPDEVATGRPFSKIKRDTGNDPQNGLGINPHDQYHRCLSLFALDMLVEVIPLNWNPPPDQIQYNVSTRLVAGNFLRTSTAAKTMLLD